ncbi:MAG: helix-turn-helix transcriptional regulator [Cellulomonadaceae bacterium]
MESRRVATYRALASTSRVTLLDALQGAQSMTIAELSDVAGLHPNTTREHLARLIDAGFVTCSPEERHTRGRPRIVYRAVEQESTGPDTDDARREEDARTELLRALLSDFDPACDDDARRAEKLGRALGAAQAAARPGTAPPATTRAGTAPATAQPVSAAGSPTPSAPPMPQPEADAEREAQIAALMTHLDRAGFEPRLDTEREEIQIGNCQFTDLSAEYPGIVCRVHLGIAKGTLEAVDGPVDCAEIVKTPGVSGCVLRLTAARADQSAR